MPLWQLPLRQLAVEIWHQLCLLPNCCLKQECLARALYCLEMGWHPSFNIATANCRMSIEEDENRGLFVALFRHIQVG